MSDEFTIHRSVEVPLKPAAAFDAFTLKMPEWFESSPWSWNDPDRAVGLRFEPGPEGRMVEVWDEATGEGYDWGRIIEWEPGRRFVMTFRSLFLPPEPLTEIEVCFEPSGDGTRVTLEHRGFEKLAAEVYEDWKPRAWRRLMKWYGEYAERR